VHRFGSGKIARTEPNRNFAGANPNRTEPNRFFSEGSILNRFGEPVRLIG
jgi:hypothetical protein